MDNLDLVIKYLNSYVIKTTPLLNNFFNLERKQALKIGNTPFKLLSQYEKIATRGKRVRGALLVLGYQIGSNSKKDSIYYASLALELIHSSLLIHDDVMDHDDLRRGVPTIHTQYQTQQLGTSMAINAGDLGFFLAGKILNISGFDPEKQNEFYRLLNDYLCRVVYGQILDVNNQQQKIINQQDILNIYQYKTAEYTGVLPLLIGAKLTGIDNDKKLRALIDYGMALGWAFQIKDELLGVYGLQELIGKPVGTDMREKKATLLTTHFQIHATQKQKKLYDQLTNMKSSVKKTKQIQELLVESGSYQYVINLGDKYISQGKKALEVFRDSKKFHLLQSFIDYVMERTV